MADSRATLCFLLLVASSSLVGAAHNNSAAVDDSGVVVSGGSHLHFYMHDDYGSTQPTAMRVVAGRSLVRPLDGSIASSARQFGDMVVFSNALTAGPGRGSPRVGTAQGHGVRVAERGAVTDLSMHLVMDDGSGSSVDVKGRIDIEAKVRESTVVGGAGRFWLARGYVLTRDYGYYDPPRAAPWRSMCTCCHKLVQSKRLRRDHVAFPSSMLGYGRVKH